MLIRPATPADAAAIAALYAHYVRETAITFATEPYSPEDFCKKISDLRYPFLVAEEGGALLGFCYAAPFREKEAYRWDVEMTIYLAPAQVGHGLGRMLLESCLRAVQARGYLNAYSCITLPNERSVGLHKALGFAELGIFPQTGYKLGKWHDVIWLGKRLGEMDGEPREVW